MNKRIVLIAIIGVLGSTLVFAEDAADSGPSATPYRPTVSTPATLSAPGWIEAELGGFHAKELGDATQDQVPYAIKLAFSEDWGIRITGNAWVKMDDGQGNSSSGQGDTGLILKRRFAIDDKSAFGLEGGVLFPTSKTGLGLTKDALYLNTIYSADIGDYHTDANLYFTQFDSQDVPVGSGRVQTGYAWAWSHNLNEQWGIAGEISGTHQSGMPNTAQALAAFSYNFTKAVVFDFGAAAGLNNQSDKWSIFGGVTFLTVKLF